jgi:hypothetical protein
MCYGSKVGFHTDGKQVYDGIRYCDIVVSYIMGNFIGAMIECHGSYEDSLNFWFLRYIAKLMG